MASSHIDVVLDIRIPHRASPAFNLIEGTKLFMLAIFPLQLAQNSV